MISGNGADRKGSVLIDSVILKRPGDPTIFASNDPDGMMSVCLAGYAVVPLEDLLDDELIERLRQEAIEYVERTA